jgi:hypothetical protein
VNLRGLSIVFQELPHLLWEIRRELGRKRAFAQLFQIQVTNQFLWRDWPSAQLKAGDCGTRKEARA